MTTTNDTDTTPTQPGHGAGAGGSVTDTPQRPLLASVAAGPRRSVELRAPYHPLDVCEVRVVVYDPRVAGTPRRLAVALRRQGCARLIEALARALVDADAARAAAHQARRAEARAEEPSAGDEKEGNP